MKVVFILNLDHLAVKKDFVLPSYSIDFRYKHDVTNMVR